MKEHNFGTRKGMPAATPKEVVISCLNAINKEDFQTARLYVSDDMSFVGTLATRRGGDAYFKDIERMRLKYDVTKVFVDGNDVCVFSNLAISGVNIVCCSWYRVANGKIHSLEVVYDPRPILEAQSKQKKTA